MNHQQLLHPHVVQLREVFAAPPFLAIVMEYVPGGDMFSHVVRARGLPEPEARWFFQQLVLGMDYCHRKGVCNRDIKLENTLLLTQPDKRPLLKMCDFGYAKSDQLDSLATSKVGT
jgi:serine/threonine-protein kinase SRK2